MSDGSYIARQRERDAEYRRDYDRWVKSLSPEERKQLASLGVDAPSLPAASGGAHNDAADSSRARCEDEFVEEDEPIIEPALPRPHDVASPYRGYPQAADDEFLHDLLRRLVGELISQNNARLSLECLALVTGLSYEGDSMTEIAKRHRVTRAAVSKRCVELTQALNLKPSRAMRSLKARQSYRSARLNNLRQQL
jgi:hypothetical protein